MSMRLINSLYNVARQIEYKFTNFQLLNQRRFVTNSSKSLNKSYDADGKTSVTMLNNEFDAGLMVNGYSQYGFRLNNNMVIMGPIIIFPRSILSWNVNSCGDINEDSLSIFYMLEPKIDVLVIGTGDEFSSPELSKNIIKFMKTYGINVEVLRTEQACATFNFLNAENRMVAAALIPPIHIYYNENDLLQKKLRNKELDTEF